MNKQHAEVKFDELWTFSLRVYSSSDVQTHLLSLQNQSAKNVNLCLFLLYLDAIGLAVSYKQCQSLDNSVQEWSQHYTSALRQIRINLKKHCKDQPYYSEQKQALLTAELEMEKQEQRILVKHFNSLPTMKSASTLSNLNHYLSGEQSDKLTLLVNEKPFSASDNSACTPR